MKFRKGFITNSSSSSFIVTNLSNEVLTNEDMARMMEQEFNRYQQYGWCSNDDTFDKFILSSNTHSFLLGPNESVTIECGDHPSDGLFENVIHLNSNINHKDFSIEFNESHH